jgi:hypothetical protein
MTGLGDTVGTADIAELLQGLADVNGSGLVVAGQPLQGAEPAARKACAYLSWYGRTRSSASR